MLRIKVEQHLVDSLGDAMGVLGKPVVADGENSYLGPAIGYALVSLGLPVASSLEPLDEEVDAVPASSQPYFLTIAKRELAKRLFAASVVRIRQRAGRDSEAHWNQLREGLAALIEQLDREILAFSGAGGGFVAGSLLPPVSPPRAIHYRRI